MSLTERDRKSVWHPFTQMRTDPNAIPIIGGKGSIVYSEDGKEYIDGISSWWVKIHGHSHPHISERIKEQLDRLHHVIFAGFTHEPAIELSERVLSLLSADHERVFFSDNGSTATEVALKMALQYWNNKGSPRKKIICFDNAYHGDTFGAMSVGTPGTFNAPYTDLLFPVIRIPTPYPGREDESVTAMKEALADNDVACFIFEPLIQGAAGMLFHEPEPLDRLVGLCQEAGVVTIADEILTGFGRTGSMFATDFLANKPDLICLSKALTGGTLPLGLTITTNSIFEAFLANERKKLFWHGHSFTGNPIACTAALASLDLMEKPSFSEDLARINGKHKLAADHLIKNCQNVQNVRVKGTVLALDVHSDGETSYGNPLRDTLYQAHLEQGVILRPLGNVIYVLPPCCTTDEQLDRLYQAIHFSISQI